MKVLIVGNRSGTNVGGAFERAAARMDVEVRVLESDQAMAAPLWIRRANWWLRGRRPTRLRTFSHEVVAQCRRWHPDCVLSVGIAPVSQNALIEIGRLGVHRVDYLTDDPWNKMHRSRWFLKAIRHYDQVYSTRRSNLDDLRRHGVLSASYLPFAYCPDLHFLEFGDECPNPEDDLIFAGGGDRERAPIIGAIINAGFRLGLYGILWERFKETGKHTRGQADPKTLRLAHGRAKVALCLPRRANRDGHTMRTFELAAMGACVLAEDSDEHREILGEDGEAVVYFKTTAQMIDRLRWLIAREEERHRLGLALLNRVTAGRNTYRDRLGTMLAGTTEGPTR